MSCLSTADFTKLLTSHREVIAKEIAEFDAQLNELEEASLALDRFTQPHRRIVDVLRRRSLKISGNKASLVSYLREFDKVFLDSDGDQIQLVNLIRIVRQESLDCKTQLCDRINQFDAILNWLFDDHLHGFKCTVKLSRR